MPIPAFDALRELGSLTRLAREDLTRFISASVPSTHKRPSDDVEYIHAVTLLRTRSSEKAGMS